MYQVKIYVAWSKQNASNHLQTENMLIHVILHETNFEGVSYALGIIAYIDRHIPSPCIQDRIVCQVGRVLNSIAIHGRFQIPCTGYNNQTA